MSLFRKQHELAVSLLEKWGLEYIRLEETCDGYRYLAWSTPWVDGNGSPRKSRRGTILKGAR